MLRRCEDGMHFLLIRPHLRRSAFSGLGLGLEIFCYCFLTMFICRNERIGALYYGRGVLLPLNYD